MFFISKRSFYQKDTTFSLEYLIIFQHDDAATVWPLEELEPQKRRYNVWMVYLAITLGHSAYERDPAES